MKAMGRFDGILEWGVELKEIIGGLFDFFLFFLDGWMGLLAFWFLSKCLFDNQYGVYLSFFK